MLYKVYNIKWDCDGEDQEKYGLPNVAQIDCDETDDVINALSDEYGTCIESVETIECFRPVDDNGNCDWVDVSNE